MDDTTNNPFEYVGMVAGYLSSWVRPLTVDTRDFCVVLLLGGRVLLQVENNADDPSLWVRCGTSYVGDTRDDRAAFVAGMLASTLRAERFGP